MFCENCGKKLPVSKVCPDCGVKEVPSKEKNVLKIFLMTLMMIGGVVIIPSIIQVIFIVIGIFENGIDLKNPLASVNANLMVISMVITPIIVTIFLLIYKRKELKDKVKDFFTKFGKNILYVIVGVTVMYILNLVVGFIMILLGEINTISDNQALLENIFKSIAGFYYILYIVDIVFLTPVFEEYLCRYIFKKHFKKGIWFIIFTSIAFGLLHCPPTSLINLINFTQYTLMGAILAFTYYKTDNILSSMLIHIINNGIAILFMI